MNKKIVILTLSLLGVTMLHAQNIIRPKVECPNGIYVNSYNGVLFYQRPDVSVTNRNMRLEAVFYYNSSSNKKNYGYGNGWSLGSELRFVNDSLGVIIEQGDGRQDLYTRYGNSFEAPAGVFSTLSFEGDGYLLTYKDGTKYYFTDTVAKKVTMVKDRYDNAITYTYQEGNLTTASDISGRSLYFTWSNDLLSGIRTSFDDRTWSYGYDENGNLTSVTDPMGYTVHYAYNKDNRIKTFTDAEGYSTHISYNTDGMAHRVKTDVTDKTIRYELAKRQTIFVDYLTDANNQYTKYVWDEQGRLVEVENVNMGTSTKFAYDDDNNLISREDANGHAYTYTYDENGNRLSATDPLGYTESYTYDELNNMITYTDKMDNVYTFSYNNYGAILQSNGPLGFSTGFTYDNFGQVTSVTDANGNISNYEYDSYGNLVTITDPMGNVTTMSYSTAGAPISETLPNGAQSSLVYDNFGRIIEFRDALNNSFAIENDRNGKIVSLIDPLNNVWNYEFNALGLISKEESPLGGNTRYYYSGVNLKQVFDPLNHLTSYVYNDDNRIIMCISATNDTTRYTYDNVGNLIGELRPNGENVEFQYDALNRIVSVSDQIGEIFVYHYDANDHVVQKENAMGYSEFFYYDAKGRLTQHTDVLGNSEYFTYDNNNNMLTYKNMNGETKTYIYNANNLVTTIIDALNNTLAFDYDANGNIISVTDPNGNVTSYEYDLLQRLERILFPNGETKRFEYDALGNIILQENEAGEKMSVTYDVVNRATSMDIVGNPESYTRFQYDLVGNLINAYNQDASSTFTYDESGRLLSESTNGIETEYSYDVANSTVEISYPSGRTITEKYDVRNRLNSVIENGIVLSSFEYDNSNALLSRAYANGLSTSFLYDAKGRMERIMDNMNSVDYELVYDAVGNIVSRKDFVNSGKDEVYAYDKLNRLIDYKTGTMNGNGEIIDPLQHCVYGMDGVGNRTIVVSNGVSTEYNTNSMNAYTSITTNGIGQVLRYDAKGNLIDDGIHTYQYDIQNKRVSVDNGNTASYKYDALDRLIQVQYTNRDQIGIRNYHYAANRLIEQSDNERALKSYIYGEHANDLLLTNFGASSLYYLKDQSHSIVAITDDDSNVVERYSYDPAGNVTYYDGQGNPSTNGSSYNNLHLYTGRTLDDFAQTYTMQGRNYNTVQARMTEADNSSLINNYSMYSDTYLPFMHNNSDDLLVDGFWKAESVVVNTEINLLKPYLLRNPNNYLNVKGELSQATHANQYTKAGRKRLENVVNDQDKAITNNLEKQVVVVEALIKADGLYEKNRHSTTCEESMRNLGGYYGDIFGGYFGNKVGSAAGGVAGGAAGGVVGSEVGSTVVGEYFAEGGRRLDAIVDVLEYDCQDFMQNGYENSRAETQWLYRQWVRRGKPTNAYYYMGLPVYSDETAEKITNFLNKADNWWAVNKYRDIRNSIRGIFHGE